MQEASTTTPVKDNHHDPSPPPRPNPNTYWVKPGRFLAGEYPGDMRGMDEMRMKVCRYLDIAKITTFIDLTEEGERRDKYATILQEEAEKLNMSTTLRHERIPIQDFAVPTIERMKEILDAIDDALENGENVYVHCWGGKGRTGVTVGCFIARHGLHPQPLEEVNRLFHAAGRKGSSPETTEQKDFIRNWKEGS